MSGERCAWVWRNSPIFLRFIGSNCQECEKPHFPPRAICPDCGHKQNLPGKRDLPKLPVEKPALEPTK